MLLTWALLPELVDGFHQSSLHISQILFRRHSREIVLGSHLTKPSTMLLKEFRMPFLSCFDSIDSGLYLFYVRFYVFYIFMKRTDML